MFKSMLATLALDGCETWSQLQVETLIEDREQDYGKNISPTQAVFNGRVKSRRIRSFIILILQNRLLGH
jgi:hypothetical protein